MKNILKKIGNVLLNSLVLALPQAINIIVPVLRRKALELAAKTENKFDDAFVKGLIGENDNSADNK